MFSGRKKDPIWSEFILLPKSNDRKCQRVQCKTCGHEVQALVDRMKRHVQICTQKCSNEEDVQMVEPTSDSVEETVASTSTNSSNVITPQDSATNILQPKLNNFITKTSKKLKENLDEQVGKFFFACNIAFQKSTHKEWLKLCNMLRPGYVPPNEKALSNHILDSVYENELSKCEDELKGETVSVSLDGWTNVNSDPVICACITKENGDVILAETIDTTGHSHDTKYLKEISIKVNIMIPSKCFLNMCTY